MAGVVTTKLLAELAEIGVDVSKKQPSNVKTLATKNKSTATKPGLLAGERDTGGNFGTVLDIFKREAQFINGMDDAQQMAFLNNILDYKEFGGKSIKTSEGIKLKDEFDKGLGTLKDDIESLQSTAKTMKEDAEKGVADAYKDLEDFLETGGQPLKKKDDRFLGGSMHEEGQLRTAIREFLKQEHKNGRIKLDKDDQFRVMEYSPMLEDDPIKVFKKIYGDEAYNKAGTFPGAFEIGENFTHYKTIFEEKMGSDLLKVKDKKYVGDGTLVLTKREEVLEPKPNVDDDDVPFAKGGRASFAGGKIIDELVAMLVKKEPMDAMKELNKIVGKKGNYKNLTQKDIDRIVDQTNDHIFQRDPDNLFVGDRNVDDMSIEDSLTTMEGLGATQTAERFRLKQKYPGITDDLVDKILIDDNPQRKAELLGTLDEAFKMLEKGKGEDEIIETFKNTSRTKNAKGGRAGYYGGGMTNMIEPDLSDIGHGSDALMARTRLTAPGSQATTSTGLNYLLGEDNDNIRVPFAGGNIVDKGRRGFLKFLGGTAAGVVALKTGLAKLLGKESGAVSKKVIDEVIIDGGSGAPAWLQPLVNKALREGTDISKQAIKDGQVVKSLDTPTGKVDVYYDARTGEIDIDYIGGNTAMGEGVQMRYTPGIADEGTKGVKPADEFEAVESVPEFQGGNYTDGPSLEFGENTVSEVKDLYSDVSELQKLGGQKELVNDISVTLQKKKILKKMDESPQEFAQEQQPDVYYKD